MLSKGDRERAEKVADDLYAAFPWGDSKHGGEYWQEVANRLEDIGSGLDTGPVKESERKASPRR